jgi:O-antigen/teichoic acid export membrane protein
MRFGQSIRHGVAWLFVGSTGNQVLTFLFGIVLARLLTPADFGMLIAIQIYTGIAGFFASGGMGQALVQAKEVEQHDYDVVFTIQLVLGCSIYAGFFLTAPYFAAWYASPLYEDLLRVIALSFILRPFVNLPGNFMYRERRFKTLALANVAALLFSSSVSVAMAWSGYGVWSLVFGGLIGSVFNAIVLIYHSGWRPSLSHRWRRGRALAHYGALVTVGDFVVYLRSQAANFVLSKTLGPHALGLFNKASSFVNIPNILVTGPVYQVIFRALAKDQDNLEVSQYIYLRSVTLVSVYSWPLFLALGWLAVPLIRLIYGEKWADAATPLAFLAIVGPFVMLEMLAGAVLAARAWLGREIPVQLTQLVLVVLGSVTGLPYGLLGVAVGASVANIYGAMHMSWLAAQCLSIPVGRIGSAMAAPFLLVVPVLSLWIFMEWLFSPWNYGDFVYLLIMLLSGGALFLLLFFLAPVGNIASERKRWLDFLKKGWSVFLRGKL